MLNRSILADAPPCERFLLIRSQNSMAYDTVPLTKTLEPADQDELVQAVRECYASETPVYPLGGCTSLESGLPAKRPGIGLSMRGCQRVIDYPARDMTITVEAGITMRSLAETLAAERQRFPIDVPQADRATLGGVIATNFNGPRRFGLGTVRDYVIGIRAVDGRGVAFKGGGRVVKNVAGYDFCKLLTGSMGTLGVITQATLKVVPIPEVSMYVVGRIDRLDDVEAVLGGLVRSDVRPSSVEVLLGPFWERQTELGEALGPLTDSAAYLAFEIEGTAGEVRWMTNQLGREWRDLGIQRVDTFGQDAVRFRREIVEFPQSTGAPLVIQASLRPSGVVPFLAAVRELDSGSSIQSHAGSGIVFVQFSKFPEGGLSRALVGRLRPVAASFDGHVVVLSNPSGTEVTHQSIWGGADAPFQLMSVVKQQFDPRDLLNPGRFVYL